MGIDCSGCDVNCSLSPRYSCHLDHTWWIRFANPNSHSMSLSGDCGLGDLTNPAASKQLCCHGLNRSVSIRSVIVLFVLQNVARLCISASRSVTFDFVDGRLFTLGWAFILLFFTLSLLSHLAC